MNIKTPATKNTFGVEIECYMDAGATAVGGYHNGVQVPWLPEGWNAQHDGSLGTRTRGKMAVEIVSPILEGAEGLRQVVKACEEIKARGGFVNSRCGLHVHIGFQDAGIGAIKRMIAICGNMEKAIYAVTGTKAREQGGYCHSIRESYRGMSFAAITDLAQCRAVMGRYNVLNLKPIATGEKPTVELRAFAGTLNSTKMVGYVLMALAMAERAKNSTGKFVWDDAKPAIQKPLFAKDSRGAGEAEFRKFMYWFGWSERTGTKLVWGNVAGEGVPTMAACVGELVRLCRKYDAATR